MYIIGQHGKNGNCKFGKNSDKICFTAVCEENENCREKSCDKRHPVRCFFFDRFRMCKFGFFVVTAGL